MTKEAERELLMLLFANTQLQIELMDRISKTEIFNSRYKDMTKKIQASNTKKINKLFSLMDKEGEDKKYFEFAFRKSTEACESFINSVENHTLENVIIFLKALNDGEVLQMPEGKHKKILNQLEPITI